MISAIAKFAVIAVASFIIIGVVLAYQTPRTPRATQAPEPKPIIKTPATRPADSPEKQAAREKMVAELLAKGVFISVDVRPTGVHRVVIGPKYKLLPYAQKQTFTSVLLAWFIDKNPSTSHLVLLDNMTNNEIGTMSTWDGKLKLQ